MFCSKCGKEIKEGAKFCTSCGQAVIMAHQPVNVQREIKKEVQIDNHSLQNKEDDDKTLLLSEIENQQEVKNSTVSTPPIDTPVLNTEATNWTPDFNQINADMFAGSQSQPVKKKKGIIGLIILLVLLILIAIGCLFFILFMQKNGEWNTKDSEKRSIEKEQDLEDEMMDEEAGEETDEGTEEEVGESAVEENTAQEEKTDYLQKAQEAYNGRDYVLALQYCEAALQTDDKNEEIYSLEADIYLEQQEVEQASIVLVEGIFNTNSSILEMKREQIIKRVTTTSCKQYNSLGTLICEVEYDASGNAVRYTHYSDGKNISNIEECSYDSWGNNIGKNNYNSNMNLEWKETYEYDVAGNMTKCTHYNSRNKKEWVDQYDYDNQNRKIELTRYNADGSLSWWDEYTYVGNTSGTKIAHPSSGETVTIPCSYSYDQLGNQTEYAEYDSAGTCTYGWQKVYNGLGDITKYVYGDSEVNYVYEYMYY